MPGGGSIESHKLIVCVRIQRESVYLMLSTYVHGLIQNTILPLFSLAFLFPFLSLFPHSFSENGHFVLSSINAVCVMDISGARYMLNE